MITGEQKTEGQKDIRDRSNKRQGNRGKDRMKKNKAWNIILEEW